MSGFEVRELSVREPGAVLRGIDLTVAPGELVGLFGVAGDAGASVLVRTMAGVLSPVAGVVRAAGEDLTGRTAAEVADRGVVLLPARRAPYAALTVHEHLRAGGAHVPARDAAAREERTARVLGWFADLMPYRDVPARSLPAPAVALLLVAAAAARGARLLLVDGLRGHAGDPATYVAALRGLRLANRADGTAVVVAETTGSPGEVDLEEFDRAFRTRNGLLRPWLVAARAAPE